MNWNLSGYKTYIAAAGLLGLAIYQASVGQFESAIQTGMAALATVGLRHAVSTSAATPLEPAKMAELGSPLLPPGVVDPASLGYLGGYIPPNTPGQPMRYAAPPPPPPPADRPPPLGYLGGNIMPGRIDLPPGRIPPAEPVPLGPGPILPPRPADRPPPAWGHDSQ